MSPIKITAAYAFLPLDEAQLKALETELDAFGIEHGMRGLVLLAPEGINSTVCGSPAAIDAWKARLRLLKNDIVFKDSTADKLVFRRWSVKLKTEIVTIKKDTIKPQGPHRHITPAEWNEMMKNDDVVILDARNDYEVAIGKFQGAIDPKLKTFHEFPAYVQKMNIPKDKKVMMYCTGGIRCEKALLAMEEEGYKNVYQLEGGILAYLEQFPHGAFEGECFVFDHRVAVNQELKPSETYGMCPHCGDPGDLTITCMCGKQQKICTDCAQESTKNTCSKRCTDQLKKMAVAK